MIDSLFVLGEDKQIVIEKHWKGRIDRKVLEPFYVSAAKCVDSNNIPPLLMSHGNTLIVVKENNLFFIGVLESENAPLLVVEFINKIISILRTYLGLISESKIRSNFSMVYQLLDEVADFGVPVITEASIMSNIIPIPSVMNKAMNFVSKVAGFSDESTWLPGSNNSNVTWRHPDIKYMKNEIMFFVVEKVNATINNKGNVLDASAYGTIRVNSRVSLNPEVCVPLSGMDTVECCKLNRCVDVARYNSSKTLQFVPLDGVFELMRYDIKSAKELGLKFYCRPNLVWVDTSSGVKGTLEVMLGSRPQNSKKKEEESSVIALDIKVKITLPKETSGANITASHGTVVFNQEERILTWVVGTLRKEETPSLKGPVFLSQGCKVPKASQVASVSFVQPNAAVSGIGLGKVTFQRVPSDYTYSSSIKTQTESGFYDIQM